MKKTSIIVLLLAALTLSVNAQQIEKLPVDTNVRVGKLDNGLTYYIRHNEMPKQRAEFHIAQAVGAILEEDSQNGLAHFLEHMAFNGTEHFPGKGIINYFESIGVNFGGNINAYTSLDETVYRLSEVPTVREGIIDSALLVMHDWSHSLLLEGDEIDSERGVIREEWRTRASAERRMWSKLNPLMYPGSQYAKRDVIGDTAVINNFEYDVLRAYYHKWYGPDLQAVIVVGDIDVDQIEQKIKTLWADVPPRENRGERPIYSVDDNKEPIVAIVTDQEAQLTNFRLMWKKNELPAQLKGTNIDYMQDLMNSLIANMMSERFDELSIKPDASFIAAGVGYGGIVKQKDAFMGIVISKSNQEKEALQTLLTQLEKMRRYGFTTEELDRAKTKILTSYERSYNERKSARNIQYTREYIRNFLDGEPIPGIEWEYEFVKQILPMFTVDIINQLAQSYITEENLIISAQAPEKDDIKLPSKEEILQMVAAMKDLSIEAPSEQKVDLTLVKKAPKAGKIKKRTYNSDLEATQWVLSNGIQVIIKPTEFKQDQILMSGFSQGGTSLISDVSELPSAVYACAIVELGGLADLDLTQLQKALVGKHVSVSPSINTYSETMDGKSSVKDFETMLQLTYLYFTQPRKDEQAFQTLIQQLNTSLKNKESNHKSIFRDSVSLTASNHSPRSIIWNTDKLSEIDLDTSFRIYKERFANPADFTFTFVGNIDPEDKQTQQLIAKWLGSLKTKKSKKCKETFVDRGVRSPEGITQNHFSRNMQIRQTTNRIQLWAPMTYSLAGDLNMEVIGRVLDMRYLESIREREGGTYGVHVAGYLNRRPVGTAILLMQFDTDPEKEERLMQIIYEEVEKIIAEGPLTEDLQKAKESMLKDYEEDLEKNGWWDGTVLPEYYRYGINYLTEYVPAVKAVTAQTVQQTLKELWQAGNRFEVVMTPEQQ